MSEGLIVNVIVQSGLDILLELFYIRLELPFVIEQATKEPSNALSARNPESFQPNYEIFTVCLGTVNNPKVK